MKTLARLLLALALLGQAACDEKPDDSPYLEFVGGGFVFNYRLVEVFYGFVARPLRDIPEGTIIEAAFEDPAGGAPLVVTQTARGYRQEFSFRSPPVTGVVAGRDYKVELRLRAPETGDILATYTTSYRSSADQSVMPSAPATVGPGYLPNPALQNPPPPGG